MIVFQPARYLLLEKVKKNSRYLTGTVLDVASGPFPRYKGYLKFDKYITNDINPDYQPDIVGSMESISLDNNSVDSILCTQGLSDVYDFNQVIKEFSRILKPAGHVVLSDDFMSFLHDEPHDYWRFTKYSLEELFRRNNFAIVKIETIGKYHSVIAQFRIRYLIERYNLYQNEFLMALFALPIKLYAKFMILLDRTSQAKIKTKFTMGWFMIAQKVVK